MDNLLVVIEVDIVDSVDSDSVAAVVMVVVDRKDNLNKTSFMKKTSELLKIESYLEAVEKFIRCKNLFLQQYFSCFGRSV